MTSSLGDAGENVTTEKHISICQRLASLQDIFIAFSGATNARD